MGFRSNRLRAIKTISGTKVAFDLAFWTFLEDTLRYYETVENEVQPEILTPVEIG
jgi:hypothetical protein